MAASKAESVDEFLAELPEDRAQAVAAVRDVVLKNLPKGYVEEMRWGMISYEVPLSIQPDTYNGKPLSYAAIASQKNHMAVYLHGVYCDDELRDQFVADYKATGKRMDMGASCVRFKKLDHLPLDVVGKAIAAKSVKDFVARVDEVHANKKSAKKKSPQKK